jgi:hypothetical protein
MNRTSFIAVCVPFALLVATCVGIRHGDLYAPNGLPLLYSGLLTMNPLTPYRNLFDRKAASYRARWPRLRIQTSDEAHRLTCLSPDLRPTAFGNDPVFGESRIPGASGDD